jgi:hypothetical protein
LFCRFRLPAPIARAIFCPDAPTLFTPVLLLPRLRASAKSDAATRDAERDTRALMMRRSFAVYFTLTPFAIIYALFFTPRRRPPPPSSTRHFVASMPDNAAFAPLIIDIFADYFADISLRHFSFTPRHYAIISADIFAG